MIWRKRFWVIFSIFAGAIVISSLSGCSPCATERKKIEKLQAENDSLKAELRKMSNVIEKLRENYQEAVNHTIELDEQLMAVKIEKLSMRTRIDSLESSLDSLREELNYWKPSLNSRQKKAVESILNNPYLTSMIASRPPEGDKWVCSERRQVKFLTKDVVLLLYHGVKNPRYKGLMVLRVNDPTDIKTWQVLWQSRL